ncbi:hypothetical protein [Nocardia sp. NPDC057440]|uniref:DUF6197 family protein n=1 Tax=Nocardia sp. NPDC057440 TaxID=3346134 RepID=UPI003670297C
MKQLTTLEILKQGLDNIETYGWRRDEYGDVDTGYCAYGACYAAAGVNIGLDEFVTTPDLHAAFTLLRKQISTPMLATWNDDPLRTKADVVAIYKRAIAQLEQAK